MNSSRTESRRVEFIAQLLCQIYVFEILFGAFNLLSQHRDKLPEPSGLLQGESRPMSDEATRGGFLLRIAP